MGVYQLTKKFRFEASHQLVHHDGKCARLHGHSWQGEVKVEGIGLDGKGPKQNMAMDYADIKAAVKPLVDNYLDHHHLNDTLKSDMPTSEFVAQWLFLKLQDTMKLPPKVFLRSVVIEETCTSRCQYWP